MPLASDRYFANSATWNRPVTGAVDVQSADMVGRLFAASGGHLNTFFRNYTIPSYPAGEATTTIKVVPNNEATGNNGFGNTAAGTAIPWNPAWQPSRGNDRSMTIVDAAGGSYWSIWEAQTPWYNAPIWYWPQLWTPYYMACGSVWSHNDLWTYTDNGQVRERGCGLSKLALLTRADEVLSGVVAHALTVTIPAYSMFGPPGSTNYLPFRAPATRNEFGDGSPGTLGKLQALGLTVDTATRARCIPSGSRFFWNYTPAELKTMTADLTEPLRSTVITLALAGCVYGLVAAETYGKNGGAGIETDGLISPATKAKWLKAGVVDDGTDYPQRTLMQRFFRPERTFLAA